LKELKQSKREALHRSILGAVSFRAWVAGFLAGFGIALVLTLIVTLWDWLENPSQIFHGAEGTHWGVVAETALSWFLPTLLYAVLIAWCGTFLVSIARKNLQKPHKD